MRKQGCCKRRASSPTLPRLAALVVFVCARAAGAAEADIRYVGLFQPGRQSSTAVLVFKDGVSRAETKSQRVFTFHAESHKQATAWANENLENVLGVEPAHRHVAYGAAPLIPALW